MPAFCITVPKFLQQRRQRKTNVAPNNDDSDVESKLGGHFFSPIPRYTNASHRNVMNSRDEDETVIAANVSWDSCEQEGHHAHSPLVAQPVVYAQQRRGTNLHPRSFMEELRNLDITMERAQDLPRNSYFRNNHVMVNHVRAQKIVSALNRSLDLDTLARWHAEAMAALGGSAFHADPFELQARLKKPSRRIGSNVGVGSSVRDIHEQMMRNKGDYNNMIDRRYSQFGMGTALGANGDIYLCQIYRG